MPLGAGAFIIKILKRLIGGGAFNLLMEPILFKRFKFLPGAGKRSAGQPGQTAHVHPLSPATRGTFPSGQLAAFFSTCPVRIRAAR